MKNLIKYILHLADTSLILTQQNSKWCGHGPVLEQDIALTNITLDLLGQARNFYQYAAQLINAKARPDQEFILSLGVQPNEENVTEDILAYHRKERFFLNLLLVEQPNGDWGQTILRQFLFSRFQYLLYEKLQAHPDEQIAAIAAKSIKETAYHLRWSSEWVIRLGDGTAESHERMQTAIENLWPYTGEMFLPAEYESVSKINFSDLEKKWMEAVSGICHEATLGLPGEKSKIYMHTGGKNGQHTENLGYILTELQYLQMAFPGAKW